MLITNSYIFAESHGAWLAQSTHSSILRHVQAKSTHITVLLNATFARLTSHSPYDRLLSLHVLWNSWFRFNASRFLLIMLERDFPFGFFVFVYDFFLDWNIRRSWCLFRQFFKWCVQRRCGRNLWNNNSIVFLLLYTWVKRCCSDPRQFSADRDNKIWITNMLHRQIDIPIKRNNSASTIFSNQNNKRELRF